MLRSKGQLAAIAMGLLASLRCVEPRTEVVVVLASDLAFGPGEALDGLRVTVRSGDANGVVRRAQTLHLGRAQAPVWTLPLAFGVTPFAGDTRGTVYVEVLGCRPSPADLCTAESALVVQRALVSWLPGRTQRLDLFLSSRCVDRVDCVRAQTVCRAPTTAIAASPACVTPAENARVNLTLFAGAHYAPVPVDGQVRLDAAAVDRPDALDAADAVVDRPDALDVVDASVADRPDAADVADVLDVVDAGSRQRSCTSEGAPGCGLALIAGDTLALGSATDCERVDAGVCAYGASPRQPMVTVSPFLLDRHEVTVARFRRYWDAGASGYAGMVVPYAGGRSVTVAGAYSTGDHAGLSDACAFKPANWMAPAEQQRPMNCVTWATALAFCIWDGGRLPTEAEWELAARGSAGREFPWGDGPITAARACWSGAASLTARCEVGSHPTGATALGIHDLAGNVMEWTADLRADYRADGLGCWGAAAQRDPLCAVTATDRSVRGGAWDQAEAGYLRGASRTAAEPGAELNYLGFRCARSP